MAERNQVVQWLRKYIGGVLGAVTIAVATITALTVSTIAVQSGGAITIDADGDLVIDGDAIAKASGAEHLTISILGAAADMIMSGGDDWTATFTDDVTLTGDVMALTGATSVASSHATGGSVLVDASGVSIAAAAAGDDISIIAVDQTTIGGAGGAGNFGRFNTTGAIVQATDAGDDVTITAADDVTITGDAWSGTFVTSSTMAVTSGGAVAAVAGGVTLTAGSAGDDIVLDTTGSGDDIFLTASATVGDVWLDGFEVGRTLVAGGATLYRLAPSLEFDFPNAAPGSTAETLMAMFAVPASAMSATGRGVRFEAHGLALANANNKTVRMELGVSGSGTGGTTFATCNVGGAAAAAGGEVWITGYVYRTGSNTQRGVVSCLVGLISVTNGATAAITDTAIIDVNLTVTNATDAADLVIYGVEWTWL